MRKTFLTFCVAALSLLAVSSCGKIWDEFDVVHGELDDLKAKVEALEKKLNDEVAALNTKIGALETAYKAADADLLKKLQEGDAALAASITSLTAKLDALDGEVDGYVKSSEEAIAAAIAQYQADLKKLGDELSATDKLLAEADADILKQLTSVGVTKVSKNDAGNVVITFTDGTTLEVGAYDANANNTGVVTVVEDEDGVKYWAVVLEDGTVESLEVPVGHVNLKFKVDSETNALMYSVDGGTNWSRTGAYVANSMYSLLTDFYQGGEMDYDTWEYVENDYYTVVFGGEEYYLPIYKADNAVLVIKAGKTYFALGETKTVDLNVVGMADFYVMSKPDGWKAKLDGKKLVITAPTQQIVDLGIADLDGDVLLHANTTQGSCKVVKLSVSTSAGLQVKVNEQSGVATIINPIVYVTEFNDEMGGMPMPMEESTEVEAMYSFASLVMGLASVEDFAADPAGYIKDVYNGMKWDAVYTFSDNFRNGFYDENDELKYAQKEYVAGEYEVDEWSFEIADLYKYAAYSEMPKGSHFVVWAAAISEDGNVMTEDASYVYYEPVEVSVEEADASFNDITVELSLYGAEKFLVGFVAESAFADYGFTFDEYMNMNEGAFGAFVNVGSMAGYEEYAEYYMGRAFPNATEGEFTVSELNAEGYAGDVLSPNTKYYVWAMPVVAGLNYGDYEYETHFKPYVYEFTTEPIVYDETSEATASISYTVTTTSINAEVEAENTVLAYYYWYEADVDVNEIEPAVLAEEVVKYGNPAAEFPINIRQNDVSPETTMTLVVVTVDADGKYSDPESQTMTTDPVPYSDEYSVELTAVDTANQTATFAVTGDAQKVVCYAAYYDYYTSYFVDWLLKYGTDYYSFKIADVVDGAATVSGLNFGTNKYLIYAGYSEDADGNYTFNEPKVVDVTTWTPAE